MEKMAKKDLNDDILSGGSISDSEKPDKSAKKAARLEKKAKKTAEKRAKIEKEIKDLREKRDSETDEKAKAALTKKIDAAKNKLDALSGKKSGLASNQLRVIKSVVAVVIVLALLVTYVATGAVRKGFIHSTLQWTTGLTAATIEDEAGDKIRIPVSTFNYYFANSYNNLMSTQQTYEQYGISLEDNNLDVDFDIPLSDQTTTNEDGEVVTWLEYLYEQVLDGIKSTYMYYNEAVKANGGEEPEITAEQQSELEDTLDQYEETAKSYGYTLSAYLVQAMGKGVTENVFRREAKISYIAQNYQSEMSDTITEEEYTDADLETYRDSNIDDFQAVSVRIFEAGSEDDAIAFKNALRSDGSNFSDLCVQYSEDTAYDRSYYAQDEASTKLYATRSILQNAGYAIATADHDHEEGEEHSEDEVLEYPGLDWLFSADRQAGDIYQYSTSVVYVLQPVQVPEASSVNVRHILIAPDTGDDSSDKSSATEEQWAAALETAEGIVDEFNSGDKTEDSFAALATENTTDSGSASNGGLYENVVPGQMVDAFESWALDPDRRSGDVGIVQTQYGYHIMYFVGDTDTPIWKVSAQSAISNEDANSAAEELDNAYSIKMNWFGRFYIEKDTDIDA